MVLDKRYRGLQRLDGLRLMLHYNLVVGLYYVDVLANDCIGAEPDGETTVGTKLDDGLEHTEFYMDEASLAKIMIKLCNLKIDEFTDWDDLETETEVW